ncbi:MAG: histone deacetylase family protein [Candidatus Asgardarchaeia archaeon]
MNKTGLFYHEKFLEHKPSFNHPENPLRLEYILDHYNASVTDNIKKNHAWITPKKISEDIIALVHSLKHIERVKKLSEVGGGFMDDDETYVSFGTYDAANLAVSACVKGVDMILNGEIRNGFALVRPPGHHASFNTSEGFCIFNNIAIAAKYAIKMRNVKRVAIVDIDAHHGNGTQEIFYNTNQVLYISFHQDPTTLYPGTGFPNEVGVGEGKGYNINIPMPPAATDKHYLMLFKEIVAPILHEFSPEIILVSVGFDAHFYDPLSNLHLTSQGYGKLALNIKKIANEVSAGRLLFILEGGYNPTALSNSAVNVITVLSDDKILFTDPFKIKPRELADRYVNKLLITLRRIHSRFWNLK